MLIPDECCGDNRRSEPTELRVTTSNGCPAVTVTPQAVHIRWMIRRDMAETLEIEQASFPQAWTEEDFIRCLRQRNAIGMVCERNEQVVGFMIYELHRGRLHLLNFAVHPAYRRLGVGAEMLKKLRSKLSAGRRTKIVTEIREENLDAQLFFARQGFRANAVLRNFYREHPGDAYLFEYFHCEPAAAVK